MATTINPNDMYAQDELVYDDPNHAYGSSDDVYVDDGADDGVDDSVPSRVFPPLTQEEEAAFLSWAQAHQKGFVPDQGESEAALAAAEEEADRLAQEEEDVAQQAIDDLRAKRAAQAAAQIEAEKQNASGTSARHSRQSSHHAHSRNPSNVLLAANSPLPDSTRSSRSNQWPGEESHFPSDPVNGHSSRLNGVTPSTVASNDASSSHPHAHPHAHSRNNSSSNPNNPTGPRKGATGGVGSHSPTHVVVGKGGLAAQFSPSVAHPLEIKDRRWLAAQHEIAASNAMLLGRLLAISNGSKSYYDSSHGQKPEGATELRRKFTWNDHFTEELVKGRQAILRHSNAYQRHRKNLAIEQENLRIQARLQKTKHSATFDPKAMARTYALHMEYRELRSHYRLAQNEAARRSKKNGASSPERATSTTLASSASSASLSSSKLLSNDLPSLHDSGSIHSRASPSSSHKYSSRQKQALYHSFSSPNLFGGTLKTPLEDARRRTEELLKQNRTEEEEEEDGQQQQEEEEDEQQQQQQQQEYGSYEEEFKEESDPFQRSKDHTHGSSNFYPPSSPYFDRHGGGAPRRRSRSPPPPHSRAPMLAAQNRNTALSPEGISQMMENVLFQGTTLNNNNNHHNHTHNNSVPTKKRPIGGKLQPIHKNTTNHGNTNASATTSNVRHASPQKRTDSSNKVAKKRSLHQLTKTASQPSLSSSLLSGLGSLSSSSKIPSRTNSAVMGGGGGGGKRTLAPIQTTTTKGHSNRQEPVALEQEENDADPANAVDHDTSIDEDANVHARKGESALSHAQQQQQQHTAERVLRSSAHRRLESGHVLTPAQTEENEARIKQAQKEQLTPDDRRPASSPLIDSKRSRRQKSTFDVPIEDMQDLDGEEEGEPESEIDEDAKPLTTPLSLRALSQFMRPVNTSKVEWPEEEDEFEDEEEEEEEEEEVQHTEDQTDQQGQPQQKQQQQHGKEQHAIGTVGVSEEQKDGSPTLATDAIPPTATTIESTPTPVEHTAQPSQSNPNPSAPSEPVISSPPDEQEPTATVAITTHPTDISVASPTPSDSAATPQPPNYHAEPATPADGQHAPTDSTTIDDAGVASLPAASDPSVDPSPSSASTSTLIAPSAPTHTQVVSEDQPEYAIAQQPTPAVPAASPQHQPQPNSANSESNESTVTLSEATPPDNNTQQQMQTPNTEATNNDNNSPPQ